MDDAVLGYQIDTAMAFHRDKLVGRLNREVSRRASQESPARQLKPSTV